MAAGADGDRVRAALIDAVSSGDGRVLADLCTAHRAMIRRDFCGWARVPAEVRADSAAVRRYARALIAVALDPTATALRLCAEQGDQAGILAYLGNLFEIHRYLGQAEPEGVP